VLVKLEKQSMISVMPCWNIDAFLAFCCPASPWWLLFQAAGPPMHFTPTGIGPERRHGFQLRLRGAEQCG